MKNIVIQDGFSLGSWKKNEMEMFEAGIKSKLLSHKQVKKQYEELNKKSSSLEEKFIVMISLAKPKEQVILKKNYPVLNQYFVDFIDLKNRLIWECDGPSHNKRKSRDRFRDSRIGKLGYKIIRLNYRDLKKWPEFIEKYYC